MPDFNTFKRWVAGDWKAHKKWRTDSREDYGFVAGDQWTEEEKQVLEDQMRVPIVFNRTATIINAVAGSEINNRTEVRFQPRTLGDATVNEMLSRGAEWFRDQAGAEDEESQAFQDALVCGLGWTETLLDFEEDAEGEPRMTRINPLEMCWDASSERRCLSDARRIARVREWDMEDAKEMFPDVAVTEMNARWLDMGIDDEQEPTRQWSDDDYDHVTDDEADADEKPKTVTIVQLQYCARSKYVEYVEPVSGKAQIMAKGDFTRTMDEARKAGYEPDIKFREISKKEWKQVFLGAKILDENQPCRDHSTFVPITGYWDNKKRQWFGLLRTMKDPQKYANKWLTQTLHIINSNSKGGIFVEDDATDDWRELEENYAAADSVIRLRSGAIAGNKIMPKPKTEVPSALMQLTEFAITSIRDVSGVNQELLGLRDQNQPGILEYQRKQAAMTTLAMLFNSLREYRLHQAEVMLFYMTEYLADGRLIRISNDDGDRYEQFTVDKTVRKYDVIVDDAPSAPNNKERVWETITNLMPVLVKAGLPNELWGEIIAYAPFPEALIEKLREFAKQPQQPDPQQQQAMQLMMQKAVADIEAMKAEAEKDKANAFENMAQGQLALAKAQAEPQMAAMEMQKDMAQAGSANIKAQADVVKSRAAITKSQLDLQGKVMDMMRPQTPPAKGG